MEDLKISLALNQFYQGLFKVLISIYIAQCKPKQFYDVTMQT